MQRQLTLPINFSCYNEIVRLITEKYNKIPESDLYMDLSVSPEITQLIEEDLQRYGLPKVKYPILFRRKDVFTSPDEVVSHLDYFLQDDTIFNVSIVFPIENCDKAPMVWFDGDYTPEVITNEHGFLYALIKWNSPPSAVYTEIIKEPSVCDISIPHYALSPQDGSCRTVLTIRLEGNPTFEEVRKKVLTKSIS